MPSLAHLTGRIVTIGVLTGLSALHAVSAADGRDIALNGNKASAHACAFMPRGGRRGDPRRWLPRLSNLSVGYLVHQLDSFAEGKRGEVVMSSIAKALSPEDRQAVAAYYSSRSSAKVYDQQRTDEKLIARGRQIALHGDWPNGIPGCGQCHGPQGEGVGASFPALAGQGSRYLSPASSLEKWRKIERPGWPDDGGCEQAQRYGYRGRRCLLCAPSSH
jgi:cytochrome c553